MSNNRLSSAIPTISIAFIVCLVCAIIVCTAAVLLKPQQDINIKRDKQKNILQAAGLYQKNIDVSKQFEKVSARVVNLNTGEYTSSIRVDDWNALKAAKTHRDELSTSFEILNTEDKIKIGRRENYVIVYLIEKEGDLDKLILPIRGYGLWSTLYGFIALEADANTIAGLGFYDQKETPGLGGEVDNPNWKQKWVGKKLYTAPIAEQGELKISVLKGKVNYRTAEAKSHYVDGLSGATLTTNGVHNLVRFWMGRNGYRLYLKKIQTGEI